MAKNKKPSNPAEIAKLANQIITGVRKNNKSHAKNIRDLAGLLRRMADVMDDIADGLVIV